jgi:predicted nicotinamide N-methyase
MELIKYDSSNPETMLRFYHGTKIYMATHPEIRNCFYRESRPTEFGDKVWSMTLRMMNFLEDNDYETILDIGCGWGLLGIHLARIKGAKVTCVDLDPLLEPLVLKHARLNCVDVEFKRASFLELAKDKLNYDLIVGSEICYNEEVCVELCRLVDSASRNGTKQLLIADPGRPDFDDLFEYCEEQYQAKLTDIKLEGERKAIYLMSISF